ncbi:hypothetical protein EKE94_14560 [Mesobaculum littorinae]|uniref:Transferrin-binding protein B C-lobe/N-lobe beta barrel domain-containing protein n=1 Tax=Mesobaculum littorinae TaxID=2486419 RepID=A0A438AF61_9RHOB|nr:hypothetical protein [Mesobaculum littorinae]RVV97235.1 hypothetical protein EKE94_14560 [Mesobaculum littorinae]
MRRLLLLFGLLVSLAACGGGGGQTDTPPGPDGPGDGGTGGDGDDGGGDVFDPDLSYDARADRIAALRADLQRDTGGVALAPSDLPSGGQGVYAGFAEMQLSGPVEAEGRLNADMQLVVDFGAGDVRGRMENFRRSDDVPVAGDLEIRNGEVIAGADPAAGPVFVADVEGTLTDRVGALDFDLDAGGAFYGTGAGYAGGALEGTAGSRFGDLAVIGEFGGRR